MDGGVSSPDLSLPGHLGLAHYFWAVSYTDTDDLAFSAGSSVWFGSPNCPDRGYSPQIAVRTMHFLCIGTIPRLLSDICGLTFGHPSSASTSHAVWVS